MPVTPRRVALAAIILMAGSVSIVRTFEIEVTAQAPGPSDIYGSAVAVYRASGDITKAVAPLQSWSRVEFDAAVKQTITARSPKELEAAAIFHLEIGVALAGVSAAAAAGHFKYGTELLDEWTAHQSAMKLAQVNDQKAFRAMWFGVAGSAFTAVKDPNRARPYVARALGELPRSARARTLSGAIKEVLASLFNADYGQTLSQQSRFKRERAVHLDAAEQDYRAALGYDDRYALAHIRLGRVLHLSGKPIDARASFERGRQLATEPHEKYLLGLFLGSMLADQKDVEGARQSFEEALAIAPASQPAVVSLAHLEVMAGRPDRAYAVTRRMAEETSPEPWWAFHVGALDVQGLRMLRERATR